MKVGENIFYLFFLIINEREKDKSAQLKQRHGNKTAKVGETEEDSFF